MTSYMCMRLPALECQELLPGTSWNVVTPEPMSSTGDPGRDFCSQSVGLSMESRGWAVFVTPASGRLEAAFHDWE